MKLPLRPAAFAPALALLAGCASTRPQTSSLPRTLDDVNAQLAGGPATIVFVDGRQIAGAQEIRIEPRATTYVLLRQSFPVATEDVALVKQQEHSGARSSFTRAAALGLFAALVALMVPFDEESALSRVTVASLCIVGGGLVGLLSATARTGKAMTVYEGPVERYLAPASE